MSNLDACSTSNKPTAHPQALNVQGRKRAVRLSREPALPDRMTHIDHAPSALARFFGPYCELIQEGVGTVFPLAQRYYYEIFGYILMNRNGVGRPLTRFISNVQPVQLNTHTGTSRQHMFSQGKNAMDQKIAVT